MLLNKGIQVRIFREIGGGKYLIIVKYRNKSISRFLPMQVFSEKNFLTHRISTLNYTP